MHKELRPHTKYCLLEAIICFPLQCDPSSDNMSPEGSQTSVCSHWQTWLSTKNVSISFLKSQCFGFSVSPSVKQETGNKPDFPSSSPFFSNSKDRNVSTSQIWMHGIMPPQCTEELHSNGFIVFPDLFSKISTVNCTDSMAWAVACLAWCEDLLRNIVESCKQNTQQLPSKELLSHYSIETEYKTGLATCNKSLLVCYLLYISIQKQNKGNEKYTGVFPSSRSYGMILGPSKLLGIF